MISPAQVLDFRPGSGVVGVGWPSFVIGFVAIASLYSSSMLFLGTESRATVANGIDCEVSVVGGGIGGVYTAYELTKRGHFVCLFEGTDRVGGRFDDPVIAGGGRLPMGGMRFYEFGNHTMELWTKLADELGIQR